MPHDLWKPFEEAFYRFPFNLMATLYSLINETSMTPAERKTLIEKSFKDFHPAYYGGFKLSPIN